MELFLATLIEYVIKFVVLVAIVALAVFCGIKVRKLSDKRKAGKEAGQTDKSGEEKKED